MTNYGKRIPEKSSDIAAHRVTERKICRNSTIQLMDNRPQTIAQRKIQSDINRRTQIRTLNRPAFNQLSAQLAKQPGGKFSIKIRHLILAKNKIKHGGKYTCEDCGFSHSETTYIKTDKGRIGDGSFHIDHIKPFSKGGLGTHNNGRVLCGTCNCSRGARNKVQTTGFAKYGNLDGGSKTFKIKHVDYKKKSSLWEKQWRRKSANKSKKYSLLDLR